MISIKNLKHYYTDADGNEVRALDGVSWKLSRANLWLLSALTAAVNLRWHVI